MRKLNLSNTFFIDNRKELASMLPSDSLAVITSNDKLHRNGDQHFQYRQDSDFFYLTGIEQEKSILILYPSNPNESLREILFIIKPNKQMEIWAGHKLDSVEATKISGINTIRTLDSFQALMRELTMDVDTIFLNLNEYVKYFSEVEYRDVRLVEQLKNDFPLHQFRRLAPLISNLRLIKKATELEMMKEACSITREAFIAVLNKTRPGMKEYEVEAEITYTFLHKGARGNAYLPIVGSGKNALTLHYNDNSDTCHPGDLLLLDFGAEYGNYAADCSRTIPVNGKFSPRQKQCYEAVLRVQKEATTLFVPGNTIEYVNKKVFAMMEKEMIGLGLFTEEDVKKQLPKQPLYAKYLMHGVSHFIGLDVHDVGGKSEPFKAGMVLTLEPGIYIEEESIGIRIENNILVAEKPIDLMDDIPREIEEIEALMKH